MSKNLILVLVALSLDLDGVDADEIIPALLNYELNDGDWEALSDLDLLVLKAGVFVRDLL